MVVPSVASVYDTFGIDYSHDSGGWIAAMTCGPALRDGDGDVHLGPVAMLADIGLSLAHYPDHSRKDSGPVTVSLTVDFVPMPPPEGRLTAQAVHQGGDSAGTGISSGTIHGADGTVLAASSMVGHRTPLPAELAARTDESTGGGGEDDLWKIFGGRPRREAGSAALSVDVSDGLVNLRGFMHGGALAALADLVGVATLSGGAARWRLASLRVDYLRPAFLGAHLTCTADTLRQGATYSVVRAGVRAAEKDVAVTTATYRQLNAGAAR